MARLGALALGLLALLLLPGCGKKASSPERTYEAFHEALSRFARIRDAGSREVAFRLLTRSSQERLAKQAETVNASLPEGATPFEPWEMLDVSKLIVNARPESVEYEEAGDGQVIATGKLGELTSRLHLEFEEGKWRVELFEAAPAATEEGS